MRSWCRACGLNNFTRVVIICYHGDGGNMSCVIIRFWGCFWSRWYSISSYELVVVVFYFFISSLCFFFCRKFWFWATTELLCVRIPRFILATVLTVLLDQLFNFSVHGLDSLFVEIEFETFWTKKQNVI